LAGKVGVKDGCRTRGALRLFAFRSHSETPPPFLASHHGKGAVTLPAIIVWLELTLFRPAHDPEPVRSLNQSAQQLNLLPFIVLAAVGCILTIAAQRDLKALPGLVQLPLGDRLDHTLLGAATYGKRAIWPANLCASYIDATSQSLLDFLAEINAAPVVHRWRKFQALEVPL
jgi:hypothetical protein